MNMTRHGAKGRILLLNVSFIMAFICSFSSDAFAARSQRSASGLSFEQAVKKAVLWHPSIDEAVNNLNMRGARIDEAQAGYMPRISGNVNSGYANQNNDSWRPKMSISATQMLYDFGKVRNSVDVATAGKQIGKAHLLLAVDQLIRETSTAYIEVQRYSALLSVANQQVKGVRSIAKLVTQRSNEGASTRSDQLQADARVEAAETTVLEISSQLERWQANLAYLTGLKTVAKVPADVPKWLGKACNISKPDWNKVPAIVQAEAQSKEAQAQLAQTRSQALPTLSLKADAGYDLNHTDNNKGEFSVRVVISGDIYQGGATSARNNAAGHALRAADAARDKARFDVQHSLREARIQTVSMGKLLGTMATRDKMMRETRDLYEQQYLELGTRSLLDVLNAEQELHQGRFASVNTSHDIRRLNIDCLYSSGMLRNSFALNGVSVRGVTLTP